MPATEHQYFSLSRVCVVTSSARVYYMLVARLKGAGIEYESRVPGDELGKCELVLTSREEVQKLGSRAAALEDLDSSPEIFRGQIVSLLDGDRTLTIGIDPGKRTGLAVYYGESGLAFCAFDSLASTSEMVVAFSSRVSHKGVTIRIGNGDRELAKRFAETLGSLLPSAQIEVVDESGTSGVRHGVRGSRGDENAAAMIAFRKGKVVRLDGTRNSAKRS